HYLSFRTSCSLSFLWAASLRALLSFPPRRSSDLTSGPSPPPSTSPSRCSPTPTTPWPRPTARGGPRRSTDGPSTASTAPPSSSRSEEHTSELQSRENLVCRLLLEKKNYMVTNIST